MPDWALPALGLFLGSSVLVALITAPLTYLVGRRTARSQEVTATAATETAQAAGQKAAADALDAHTREWAAMFQTAQALATMASAQADTVKAQLAEARTSHAQDMLEVKTQLALDTVKLAECDALNAALVGRFEELERQQSHASTRLETLENGQPRA